VSDIIAEYNSQLARVLTSQCLKFCDDTPSIAMFPTANNPQDLDLDYLEAIFQD